MCFTAVLPAGCSTLMLRNRTPSPYYQAVQSSYRTVFPEKLVFSEPTQVFLRTANLDKKAVEFPAEVIAELEKSGSLTHRSEILCVITELAYQEGMRKKSTQPKVAAKMFILAANYSFSYLFDPALEQKRSPYSPSFSNMCRWFNESTENLLRLISKNGKLRVPPDGIFRIPTDDGVFSLAIQMKSTRWQLMDFDYFQFSSDYEVTGLKNRYRTYGLGVPLIARCRDLAKKPVDYHYCHENHSVPITIFFRLEPNFPSPGFAGNRGASDDFTPPTAIPVAELYDTLEFSSLIVGSVTVPLDSDYTTPLAYSMEGMAGRKLATLGLLNPDELFKQNPEGTREIKGLYMAEPYDSHRIPVILVHGLWSSPLAWMDMYNTLNSFPAIRRNYQIWFYLYPNGQPFWVSAAQFREDLAELRQRLDPNRLYENFDRMILVGHSMGGLIATLQTLSSDEKIWNVISDVPVSQTTGDAEVKESLDAWFHYTQNPSVRCVITLATPFRGSEWANSTTAGLAGMITKKPSHVQENLRRFTEKNQKIIRDKTLLEYEFSLPSLQTGSPFWKPMHECTPAPWVAYHNVVAVTDTDKKHPFKSRNTSVGDGVVTVESARVRWAKSETRILSEHSLVPEDPQAILEVANILLARLGTPGVWGGR